MNRYRGDIVIEIFRDLDIDIVYTGASLDNFLSILRFFVILALAEP
jgi:hypothetical protein